MPEARGRITVDLTPEMRRQLKSVAAQVDMTMRELVTESLKSNIAAIQRALAENGGAPREARRALSENAGTTKDAQRLVAEQMPAIKEAQRQMAAIAAVNDSQMRVIQQLTEPIQEQLATIAAQAAAAVHASQREAIEQVMNRMREQLAPLAQNTELAAAVQHVVEQQRAALQEALEGVERTYASELVRAQQAELAAIQQQLDPFTRDWGSDEDSIYDDVE